MKALVNFQMKLELNEKAIPVCNRPRRVPINVHDKLKEQLNRMVKFDLIEVSDEPNELQSNLVVIEKPDSILRLCLNPKDINKYILRDMYQIPTLEELLPFLSNKYYYSLFDLKDGFYHYELEEESKNL